MPGVLPFAWIFSLKRGLAAAFLGVSACLYNPIIQQGEHLTLKVFTVSHPHTSDMIAAKVSDCFEKWGIKTSQVMLVITDNGANMIKAFKTMFVDRCETGTGTDSDEEDDDEVDNINEDKDYEDARAETTVDGHYLKLKRICASIYAASC